MKLLNARGNIGALTKWLRKFEDVTLVEGSDVSDICCGQCLVLPGGNVGSISSAEIKQDIIDAIDKGVRIFAICGAFQTLFSGTVEVKHSNSLGLFDGFVVKLSKPKIGYSKVCGTWFSGVVYNNCMYNVESRQLPTELCENVIVSSDGFTSAIKTNNVLGVQFHPELSNGNFDLAFQCWLDEK